MLKIKSPMDSGNLPAFKLLTNKELSESQAYRYLQVLRKDFKAFKYFPKEKANINLLIMRALGAFPKSIEIIKV